MKLTPEQLAALAAGASLDEVLASADVSTTPAVDPQIAALGAEVDALAAELATVKAEAEAAKVAADTKLAEMATNLAAAEAASTAMTEVIEARVKNMSVALGSAVPDKVATAQELVAQHAELETKFKSSFKVGAPTKKAAEPTTKPLFTEAQLAAAKLIPVL